jgi:hypothetical protein
LRLPRTLPWGEGEAGRVERKFCEGRGARLGPGKSGRRRS